ncbi:hypothetical protein [Conexivisphaera calida]|uniref:hypothetical protein n=1 Tax=Conexivisphaera calida TaxID=1874277 RepID=UPI00157B44A2|nr:hypothetical protein [Conexivisphaera calida]
MLVIAAVALSTIFAYQHAAILVASSFSVLSVGASLLATGLHEYSNFLSSTTELELKDGGELEILYPFVSRDVAGEGCVHGILAQDIGRVYTISAVLYNGGRAIAKYVKAALTLDEIEARDGQGGRVKTRISGELLPWAVPEPQFGDPRHAINVNPYQAARLCLFDFYPDEQNAEIVNVDIYREYDPKYEQYETQNMTKLDKDRELRLTIAVSGENLRHPLIFCLSVTLESLTKIVDSYKRETLKPEDLRKELKLSTQCESVTRSR